MAIPGFQACMLPLLQLAADGDEHMLRDSVDALAEVLHLSPDERAQRLAGGTMTTLYNRVTWASSYLRAAGLLEATGRGRFRITAAGQGALRGPPERIDTAFLLHYPAFRALREGARPSGPVSEEGSPGADEQTPEEAIASSYAAYRAAVEQDLLERVKQGDPAFLERLIPPLLVAMGYGGSEADIVQAMGRTGDGGIDGAIKEDKLGLESLYIQAKRYEGPVGRPAVQAFAGSLEGQHGHRGVFITTGTFSDGARRYVQGIEKRIVLDDGRKLARLMFDYGVGVTRDAPRYEMKRVDPDFFEDPVVAPSSV